MQNWCVQPPFKCYKKVGAYVERHGLFGPGLLHLVVHDGVVDAKATEDHKGLKHTTLLLHSQGHGTPKQGDMFDVITDKQLVHTHTRTHMQHLRTPRKTKVLPRTVSGLHRQTGYHPAC